MKKVFVIAAAISLLAAPAMATIVGTKHDLSSTNTTVWGAGGGSDTDQVCVFCHTPHGGASASSAPLWNRTTVNATAVYGDPVGTMDATPTLNAVNASDAILCLSCHDGASLTANLTNPPNSLGGAQPTVTATLGAAAQLGTDLSNDHPVGFSYATATTTDTELVASPAGVTFYPTDTNGDGIADFNDGMWCSSCHDVHDNTNAPFLVKSNAASALCTTCHIK
ncbi:MAG: cytochrome c3 family protein [Geothermobacteraceae bacterium]